MTCSGVGDDEYSPFGLPPIPVHNQVGPWNGKEIHQLDKSHSLLDRGIAIPTLPEQKDNAAFFLRLFIDLTFADLSDDAEDSDQREWTFAEAQPFFESLAALGLTVEEILAQRGLTFDQECGQIIDCKSWLKRIGHSIEKHVRRGAKKTVDFVKEHKKEILIGAAVLALGAAATGVALVVIGTEAAANVAAVAAASTAKVLDSDHHSSRRREEEEDKANGPDPHGDPLPPPPEPVPQQPSVYASSAQVKGNGNIAERFFDNLLKPTSPPSPHTGIYRIDVADKHGHAAPPQVEPPAAISPLLAPHAANSFRSDFGAYLENLHRSQIGSYQNPFSQSNESRIAKESVPSQGENPPATVSSTNLFTTIVEKIRQGLQTIGRGESEPEMPDLNASAELFNKGYPRDTTVATSSTPQSKAPASAEPGAMKSEFGSYLENLYRSHIDSGSQSSPDPQNHIKLETQNEGTSLLNNPIGDATIPNTSASDILINVLKNIRQGLETIGRGLSEPEPPSNSSSEAIYAPAPVFAPAHGKKLDEASHMPMMLFTTMSLPTPPDVGMVPILCPNGKLDWIVLSADWHRFQFSSGELEIGLVNLDEHLNEFIPRMGSEISIISSQNGINVKIDEFSKDCVSDNLKIGSAMLNKAPRDCPKLPLYIGIYNPTQGIIKDLHRVEREQIDTSVERTQQFMNEIANAAATINFSMLPFNPTEEIIRDRNRVKQEGKKIDTPIVVTTRQFMTVIAGAAEKINSNFLWLDLRHSEAGLIFCRAFEGMPKETKDILKNNLLSVALGPAEPISKNMAKDADNIYSEKDRITKRYAEPFMDNPDYNIRVIACISSIGEFSLYLADHARTGTTYDTALQKKIDDLQREMRFYNGKEHE